MSNSPEQLNTTPENTAEIAKSAGERLEQLKNQSEKGIENNVESSEKKEAQARHEALESAVSVEAGGAETKKGGEPSHSTARGPISKKQKEVSYKRTMKQVQAELSPASRNFSKVIHNKGVEKTSEVVGSTIARPNAVLSGAVFAFLITLIVYVVAKHFGYVLSGFESIAAFIIGWVLGVIYDYLRLLITGKTT